MIMSRPHSNTYISNGASCCSIFSGKGVFWGVVSGRFPEISRDSGVLSNCHWQLNTREEGYIFLLRFYTCRGSEDEE